MLRKSVTRWNITDGSSDYNPSNNRGSPVFKQTDAYWHHETYCIQTDSFRFNEHQSVELLTIADCSLITFEPLLQYSQIC
jgi:hypothetical protein